MRNIRLTVNDVDTTFKDTGATIELTGTDTETNARVTFASTPYTAMDLIERVRVLRELVHPVHAFQILAAAAAPEPVRGEWDSPGTSPEGDDD